MQFFHSFDTMDWGRVSLIVAAVTAFWIGLAAIMPEKYYRVGTTILAALSSAITLMMRSGRSRADKIEEKVEEYKAEGVKKRKEIHELISNEVAEKTEEKK